MEIPCVYERLYKRQRCYLPPCIYASFHLKPYRAELRIETFFLRSSGGVICFHILCALHTVCSLLVSIVDNEDADETETAEEETETVEQ